MGIPDVPQGSACNGKIDILFAIGQGGVTEHLDVLQASYAGFAATMMETFADHDIIGGVPARVIRRREPGVGWVRPDGSGDVIAESPTIAPGDLHAALDELERDQAADAAGA